MQFTCGVCQEDFRPLRSTQIILPNGDDCCVTCFRESIVPQLHDALTDPIKYPFEWGNTPLYFQDYERWIPTAEFAALSATYEAKKEELGTLPADRVYCDRDGTFLGAKGILMDSQGSGRYYCECGRKMCAECGANAESAHQVGCAHRSSKEDLFQGLKAGVDFQRCPSCKTAFALADGCNSVQCANCRVEFCFLCGAGPVAHGDKTHWQRGPGRCPRFGRPDSDNALFDDQVQVVDAAPDAHWQALFDEKDARRFLLRVREHLLGMQDRAALGDPGVEWSEYHQRVLELSRDLHKAWGVFDMYEERFRPLDGWDKPDVEVFRHRRILDFQHFEGAMRAWDDYPGLQEAWAWYLSHHMVVVRAEGNDDFRMSCTYGDPALPDAISPDRWHEALEGASDEELRRFGEILAEAHEREVQEAQGNARGGH